MLQQGNCCRAHELRSFLERPASKESWAPGLVREEAPEAYHLTSRQGARLEDLKCALRVRGETWRLKVPDLLCASTVADLQWLMKRLAVAHRQLETSSPLN